MVAASVGAAPATKAFALAGSPGQTESSACTATVLKIAATTTASVKPKETRGVPRLAATATAAPHQATASARRDAIAAARASPIATTT